MAMHKQYTIETKTEMKESTTVTSGKTLCAKSEKRHKVRNGKQTIIRQQVPEFCSSVENKFQE